MIKKLILVTVALSSACVYAANTGNKPSLGSAQSSDQTFGEPAITGSPGQVFNASAPYSDGNIETVGSRQGSNHIFGNPPITGEKGKVYNSKADRSNGPNNPAVGAKNGSNQLFGNPTVSKKTPSAELEE